MRRWDARRRRIAALVDRLRGAWESNDVESVVAMLTENAAIAIPRSQLVARAT